MSFDLYFAGAKQKDADNYLLEEGANRLQSQLFERSNILNWVNNKQSSSKLFIDSGAYTAYTKQVNLDVDEYIDFINSITDRITIFAQVDKIPGEFRKPKTREQILEAPKLSWNNYLYMRQKVKQPEKLVPIFHQGEDYKWLINMLEWTDENGEHIPYIGISPAVDVPGIEVFLDRSFDIIKQSSNPNVKTHAFGMTRLDLLEIYPYTSADSTSWKLAGAMGSIYTPYGTIYVSKYKKNDVKYIKNQSLDAYNNLCKYIEDLGFTFDEVANSDVARYICNIKYLLNWVKNYKFKGKNSYQNKLFDI